MSLPESHDSARATQARFLDGTWDVFIGLGFLGMGLTLALFPDQGSIFVWVGFAVAWLVSELLRRRLIEPRCPIAPPAAETARKGMRLIALALGFTLIAGIVQFYLLLKHGQGSGVLAFLARNAILNFGIVLGIILCVVAFAFGVRRYFGYAALMVVVFALTSSWLLSNFPRPVPMAISFAGMVITLGGVIVMRRYLKTWASD